MRARLEGWEGRLVAVVEAARQQPYVLGAHDCFKFTCDAVEALTGENRWAQFAGYTTKRQALAMLARYGSSFEAAFTWFFASPTMPVLRAQRGDALQYVDAEGEHHLGICLGADAAVLAPDGLRFIPVTRCARAWKVG